MSQRLGVWVKDQRKAEKRDAMGWSVITIIIFLFYTFCHINKYYGKKQKKILRLQTYRAGRATII